MPVWYQSKEGELNKAYKQKLLKTLQFANTLTVIFFFTELHIHGCGYVKAGGCHGDAQAVNIFRRWLKATQYEQEP